MRDETTYQLWNNNYDIRYFIDRSTNSAAFSELQWMSFNATQWITLFLIQGSQLIPIKDWGLGF